MRYLGAILAGTIANMVVIAVVPTEHYVVAHVIGTAAAIVVVLALLTKT